MQDKLERLIKLLYQDWKKGQPEVAGPHPDEEAIACFIEGRLSQVENEGMITHLIACNSCADILATQAKIKLGKEELPPELLERIQDMVAPGGHPSLLEIVLSLKEQALEILSATGDILLGQELIPAPVLRSRGIKDFKDEVTILRDFKDIRVEVKIENKRGEAFNLTVVAKDKETQKILKDLRVSLLKGNLELESYLSDSGRVTFEHVLLGKYIVEISQMENKLACVLLDIKT